MSRRTIICGLTPCPFSTIIAYMFHKSFPNLYYNVGHDFESKVEPNTNYVFVHGAPDEEYIKEMKELNSTATIVATEKDPILDAYGNVKWILGEHHLTAVFNALTKYGKDLSPITLEKLNRCNSDDVNFNIVEKTIVGSLADTDDDIEENVLMIFDAYDDLFGLSNKEIDLIAKYVEMVKNEIVYNSLECLYMTVADHKYVINIVESHDLSILTDLEHNFKQTNPSDLVFVSHTHFKQGEYHLVGRYREGINIEPLRQLPNIYINEEKRKINFTVKNLSEYFSCKDPPFNE